MDGLDKLCGKGVEEMEDGRRGFKVSQEGKEIGRNGARVCENEDVDMMCQMCMSTVRWCTVHSRGIKGIRRSGGSRG